MTTWLLSIAGIVVVGALVEVLLSDSSVHKFIRSIYAFFVLFIIAQPIPGFFRSAANSLEAGGGPALDSGLAELINTQTSAALQRNAHLALEAAGFEGVIVTLHKGAVYVNALGASFKNPGANISMKDEIIKIVRAVIGASVEVYYAGV